jgi:hypothetical protein
MRTNRPAALLVAALTGLLARPTAAQETVRPLPSAPMPAAPSSPAPAPPGPSAGAALADRALRERLFAHEALAQDSGDRVVKDNQPLAATDAYRLLGRPDLVKRVHNRKFAKGVLITAGLLVISWSLLALASPGRIDFSDTGGCGGCNHSDDTAAEMSLLLGAGATVMGIVLDSDPLSHDEKARLLQDYNQRLRSNIGLAF